jgi:regulatory protein
MTRAPRTEPPRRGSAGRAAEPPEYGAAAEDREPDAASVARALALRQLAAAPRSRAQLEAALARRQVPQDVAGQVLDRFAEVGLVDDVSYAETLVRSRHDDRGLARRALVHELRAKGVSPEIADRALAHLDPDQERERARALVARRAAATVGLEHERRRRRLVSMLARKGYAAGVALAVVDEVLRGEGIEDRDPDVELAPELDVPAADP